MGLKELMCEREEERKRIKKVTNEYFFWSACAIKGNAMGQWGIEPGI